MSSVQLPSGFDWAESIELGSPEVYRLSALAWPRFLLEESDFPDPLLKFQISRDDFKKRFRAYGIRESSSGLLVAFIQAVHVAVDPDRSELPDLGWRFSIQNAAQSSTKNCMSLVEASIDSKFRGHGLSKCLIERCKEEARKEGFQFLIAPVRPTLKEQFPNESIESYCKQTAPDGRIFDPWLRTHVEAGATLMNVCHNSVCVQASLTKWRDWTGLPFLHTGPQPIPHGLMPVMVNPSMNVGIYSEPNVWVRYLV